MISLNPYGINSSLAGLSLLHPASFQEFLSHSLERITPISLIVSFYWLYHNYGTLGIRVIRQHFEKKEI